MALTRATAQQQSARQMDGHAESFHAIVGDCKLELSGLLVRNIERTYVRTPAFETFEVEAECFARLSQFTESQTTFASILAIGLLRQDGKSEPVARLVHKKVDMTIVHSKEFVRRYETLCHKVVSQIDRMLPGQEWNTDCGKLQILLDAEKTIAIRHIHKLLDDRSIAPDEHRIEGKARSGEDIWSNGLLEFQRYGEEYSAPTKGDGWGMIARHAEKNVRRIVRYLPDHVSD